METARIKTYRRWAIVIGLGLALSPIHNQWLTDLVTKEGLVGFFIPSFGYCLWMLATLYFIWVVDTWRKNEDGKWVFNWRLLDFGDKKLYIPMFILVASIGLSGIINGESWNDRLSPLLMALSMFTLYLAGRKLGPVMFRSFIPFVIIGAVIAVVLGVAMPGVPMGGLITNYCASAGFLIFGAVVNQGKWQWLLIGLAALGVFFIGALEGVFIIGVLGIVFLARREVDWRFMAVLAVMVCVVGVWLAVGYAQALYQGNENLRILIGVITGELEFTPYTLELLTTYRVGVINGALRDISWIGHGYYLGTAGGNIVHNIPLIIMHQVGPVAAAAWVFATVYCLIRTKWKYAWIAVLAMCVFDHYIWTQFAPYWWCLAGISTGSNIKSDLIFRGNGE